MKFWIPHPAANNDHVSFMRWIAWHISQWLYFRYRRLETYALYGDDGPDIPF